MWGTAYQLRCNFQCGAQGRSRGERNIYSRPDTGEGRNHLDFLGCPQWDSEHRPFTPPLVQVSDLLCLLCLLCLSSSESRGSECSVRKGRWGWRRWPILLGSCQRSEKLLHLILTVVPERKIDDFILHWKKWGSRAKWLAWDGIVNDRTRFPARLTWLHKTSLPPSITT